MSEKSRERLVWVDQLKGLTISVIFLFHFFQNYPDGSTLVAIINRNGTKFGYEAVEIFLVLAGFNISYNWTAKRELNWSKWLKKRMFRLYPSYWLAIIFTLVLYWLFSKIKVDSWGNLILIILGFPNFDLYRKINPGFWFFAVIVQAYLITPLLFYRYSKDYIRFLKIAVIIGIAYKLVGGYLLLNNQMSIFYYLLSQNLILSYLFSFCLGIYWGFVYKEHNKFRGKDWLYATILLTLALVPYIILSRTPPTFYKLGFDIFFTPLCFLLCYWICEKLIGKESKLSSIIAVLGVFSYHIFLIHQPLLFISLPVLVARLPFSKLGNLGISLIIVISLISVYAIFFIKLDDLIKKKISILLK